MKIFTGVLIGFLVASVFGYAGMLSNPDGSKTFTYQVTAIEWKALTYLFEYPEEEFNHLFAYKISKAEYAVITREDLSDKKFEKLSKAEITTLISNATLKTRVERDAETIK